MYQEDSIREKYQRLKLNLKTYGLFVHSFCTAFETITGSGSCAAVTWYSDTQR